MTQAALAALTGQINRAADLSSRFNHWPFVTADGRFVETPASVAAIANRLLVYAAFGTPEDSIRSLAARLRREIEHSVDAPQREAALEATMLQPSLLAFPVLPPPVTRLLPTARIEQAVSRGALDEARREFAAQAAIRQFQLPWDVALDHAVLEARLLGHLGDSAAARARLDPYLDNPVGPGTDVLELVTQAAAVGRVMALWRELGNGSRAAASDTALKALWHHADGLLARQRRP